MLVVFVDFVVYVFVSVVDHFSVWDLFDVLLFLFLKCCVCLSVVVCVFCIRSKQCIMGVMLGYSVATK